MPKTTKLGRLAPIKSILFITIFLGIQQLGIAQIDELVNEIQDSEEGIREIAISIVKIVKIIAAVAVVVGGLSFLYLRSQDSDLAKKVGNIVLGIAVFFILLTLGENIGGF